jgi:hypothetical protein
LKTADPTAPLSAVGAGGPPENCGVKARRAIPLRTPETYQYSEGFSSFMDEKNVT